MSSAAEYLYYTYSPLVMGLTRLLVYRRHLYALLLPMCSRNMKQRTAVVVNYAARLHSPAVKQLLRVR